MTEIEQSRKEATQDSPQKAFATALLFVETGSEAKTHADQALVLLAVERPDLRYSIYKKVCHALKPTVGALFTAEEAAFRISDRYGLEPFAMELFRWIHSESPKDPCSFSFRQRDLDRTACSRYHRDHFLGELRAIGVTEPTEQKHMHRLTPKGVAAYTILKSKDASTT